MERGAPQEPEARLGVRGRGSDLDAILSHAYFAGFEWQATAYPRPPALPPTVVRHRPLPCAQALLAKQIRSPYVPKIASNFDTSNFDPDIDEGFSGPELLALAAAPPTGDAADSWDTDF